MNKEHKQAFHRFPPNGICQAEQKAREPPTWNDQFVLDLHTI